MNTEYENIFSAEELNQFIEEVWEKRTRVEKEYIQRIKEEQKKRQQNFDKLPDELLEQWRQELLTECNYKKDNETIERLKRARTTKLNELAPQITFYNDLFWNKIDSCSTSVYRSQTQSHFYTKNSLKPLSDKLKFFGVITEIRWKPNPYDSTIGSYELWAACPLYMADAAKRLITLADYSHSVGRTANLAVHLPLLPHELLEKHFAGEIPE